MELPTRQTATLVAIKRYIAANGFPPTVRELADDLGVSVNGAAGHLKALARKGVIHRHPGTARGITVPQADG